MKIKNIFLPVFLFCSINLIAQNGSQNWLKENSYDRSVSIYDGSGKAFVNPYADAIGSPFFIDEWKPGNIKMYDNKEYHYAKFRMNLQSQEVHFISADQKEMVVPVGAVKQVILFDSSQNGVKLYVFQSGFPAIDNQNVNTFYLVLSEGKLTMLEAIKKAYSEDKDVISGEIKKEFTKYEDYYLYAGATMQKLKKDKAYILNFFGDKKNKVEEYSTINKLGYKSTDDIRKIIDYYNTL